MAARWNLLVVPVEGETMNGGNVDTIKIESDEHGFELHIDSDEGEYVFNIHGCADSLLKQCLDRISPWIAEAQDARRAYDRERLSRIDHEEDDMGPWPGESALAFWQRTGNDDPLRDQADLANKARKEN